MSVNYAQYHDIGSYFEWIERAEEKRQRTVEEKKLEDEEKRFVLEKKVARDRHNYLPHSVLRLDDLSRLISSFAGPVSELPLAIEGRRKAMKVMIGGKPFYISTILSLPWKDYEGKESLAKDVAPFIDEIKGYESLALSSWYSTQRVRLGVVDEEGYNVPCTSDPWREVVPLGDAEWYFRSPVGGSLVFSSLSDLPREPIGPTVLQGYNGPTGCVSTSLSPPSSHGPQGKVSFQRCQVWLLYYYGLIKEHEVPPFVSNVLHLIKRDAWHLVNPLIQRGHLADITTSSLLLLSLESLCELLARMRKEVLYLKHNEYKGETCDEGTKEKLAVILQYFHVECTVSVYLSIVQSEWRSIPVATLLKIFKQTLTSAEKDDILKIFNTFQIPLLTRGVTHSDVDQSTVGMITGLIIDGKDQEAMMEITYRIATNKYRKEHDEYQASSLGVINSLRLEVCKVADAAYALKNEKERLEKTVGTLAGELASEKNKVKHKINELLVLKEKYSNLKDVNSDFCIEISKLKKELKSYTHEYERSVRDCSDEEEEVQSEEEDRSRRRYPSKSPPKVHCSYERDSGAAKRCREAGRCSPPSGKLHSSRSIGRVAFKGTTSCGSKPKVTCGS